MHVLLISIFDQVATSVKTRRSEGMIHFAITCHPCVARHWRPCRCAVLMSTAASVGCAGGGSIYWSVRYCMEMRGVPGIMVAQDDCLWGGYICYTPDKPDCFLPEIPCKTHAAHLVQLC